MSLSLLRCIDEVVIDWPDAVAPLGASLGVCACAELAPSAQIVMTRAANAPVILFAPLVFTMPPLPFFPVCLFVARYRRRWGSERDAVQRVLLVRLDGL